MIERQIGIPTRDGEVTTFICHPERGGPHPAIVFYMDAPGIREELREMARRLAAVGYYVLLPNLYYRAGVMELGTFTGADAAAVRARMMELMEDLTIPMVMDDTDALLAFLATQPAASIYGVRLVTDAPDSPHRVAERASAELYFACAQTDHWAPPEMVETLARALADSRVDAEVEIYPGVEHGFAFPARAAYDRAAAERHWERLFALFRRRLST
ncbi:MAG: dienelactone hydrolase family protein [Pseudomonadota bacterium]|nr:dienelactone hydrolase family protein [Pseudomonadota bacterium]